MDLGARTSAGGLVTAVIAAALAAGCPDEAEERTPQPLAPLPPGPAAEPADPYLRSSSRFGVVHLHAGFNPDPRVVEGTTEGTVQAETLHRRCRGWTSAEPDYLVAADTAFLQLYVIGRAPHGLSLVLRKPDGTVVCKNNRSARWSPVLRTDLPMGTSQLWVGVPEEHDTTAYSLGFSEVTWRASSVPMPDASTEPTDPGAIR